MGAIIFMFERFIVPQNTPQPTHTHTHTHGVESNQYANHNEISICGLNFMVPSFPVLFPFSDESEKK